MSAALIIGLKLSWVFVLHFLADWALQSQDMSRNKSTYFKTLLQHVSVHLAVFFIGLLFITSFQSALVFSVTNAVVHGFIDWYLWRGYKVSVVLRKRFLIPKEKWEEWGVEPKELGIGSILVNFILGFDSAQKELELTPHGQKIKDYLLKEFKYWDDFLFGFMLGFDQMLHLITLALIFCLMFL